MNSNSTGTSGAATAEGSKVSVGSECTSAEIGLSARLTLRPKEAAAALGISDRTLRHWMSNEDLPFLRLNGVVLIPRRELEHWIESRVTSATKTDAVVAEILNDIS